MLRAASSRAAEEARPGAGTARARRGTAQHISSTTARPCRQRRHQPGHQGVRLLGLGPTRTSHPRFPARGRGGSAPIPPHRGLPPGLGSVLFRCRRSRRVGRAIYSERRPRQRGSPAPPPARPRCPRPQPREEAGEGTARVIYCRDSPKTPHPPAPGRGGWRRALGAAGACTRKRVPGLCWGTRQPEFSRQWSGNDVFRGCCCLSVPRPARTAREGHRWPLRGWGARPLGRWSGCSLPERQNALPPDGTHGHLLTPV